MENEGCPCLCLGSGGIFQSGGSALFIYWINTERLHKRERPPIWRDCSLYILSIYIYMYIETIQNGYKKERGFQSGGSALFIYRTNTERLHKREWLPIRRECFLYKWNQYRKATQKRAEDRKLAFYRDAVACSQKWAPDLSEVMILWTWMQQKR